MRAIVIGAGNLQNSVSIGTRSSLCPGHECRRIVAAAAAAGAGAAAAVRCRGCRRRSSYICLTGERHHLVVGAILMTAVVAVVVDIAKVGKRLVQLFVLGGKVVLHKADSS